MVKSILDKIARRIASGEQKPTVVYSAILIDEADRRRIVADAVHPNLYGDHVTLWYYGNAGETDTPYAGEKVELRLTGHFSDERGEAWTVECGNSHAHEIMEPSQVMHVTVSCANGTKPVYSNELVRNSTADGRDGFSVHGRIAYYMSDHRWIVG